MIVTVEGQKGHEPPELTSKDITIRGNKHEFQVEELVPLRGERANLQLAVMIDDGSDSTLGLQFDGSNPRPRRLESTISGTAAPKRFRP
jgi:hypothetical protein